MKKVAIQADTVDDMQRGTIYGPTRFGPFSRVVSKAVSIFAVEGPPEPAIKPVRGFDTSSSPRPASAMACSMASTA